MAVKVCFLPLLTVGHLMKLRITRRLIKKVVPPLYYRYNCITRKLEIRVSKNLAKLGVRARKKSGMKGSGGEGRRETESIV